MVPEASHLWTDPDAARHTTERGEVPATTHPDDTDCRLITCQATGSLQTLLFTHLTTHLANKYYYCPHFSDEKNQGTKSYSKVSQCQVEAMVHGRGAGLTTRACCLQD